MSKDNVFIAFQKLTAAKDLTATPTLRKTTAFPVMPR
jgi:hypothetical protein